MIQIPFGFSSYGHPCGFTLLERCQNLKQSEKDQYLYMLGIVSDFVFQTMQQFQAQANLPALCPDKVRDSIYARRVRKWLKLPYKSEMGAEIALAVLVPLGPKPNDIPRNKKHIDKSNPDDPLYGKTGCYSQVVTANGKDMYLFQVIIAWRKWISNKCPHKHNLLLLSQKEYECDKFNVYKETEEDGKVAEDRCGQEDSNNDVNKSSNDNGSSEDEDDSGSEDEDSSSEDEEYSSSCMRNEKSDEDEVPYQTFTGTEILSSIVQGTQGESTGSVHSSPTQMIFEKLVLGGITNFVCKKCQVSREAQSFMKVERGLGRSPIPFLPRRTNFHETSRDGLAVDARPAT
ncbi:unnamed protein product [Cylindrotheca closterium]|uniref:Uncharacterized protein n=1 Tax=Cylindrotheca closterium TaxID=2856 RepID=A0AAD2FHP2_9STRA|nr:unnamed protein product [Cylindrotheca closterium]